MLILIVYEVEDETQLGIFRLIRPFSRVTDKINSRTKCRHYIQDKFQVEGIEW